MRKTAVRYRPTPPRSHPLKIKTKTVGKLDTKEYRACYRLNMGSNGLMRFCLVDERANCPESLAVMVWDGDRLMGWALMTPTTYRGETYLGAYARRTCKYSVQFYVRVSQRRRGVARRLMNEVLRHDTRPFVIPWDSRSASFFADYTVSTDGYRRRLINAEKKKKRRAA